MKKTSMMTALTTVFMFSTIVLNWTGKTLTGEQMLVLQRAAAQFPEADHKDAAYAFEHRLCEGLLTCKGSATVGTFSGVVFHAYLGTVKNEPWTHEFMLVAGFQETDYADDVAVTRVDITDDGAPTLSPVDKSQALGVKLIRMRKQ